MTGPSTLNVVAEIYFRLNIFQTSEVWLSQWKENDNQTGLKIFFTEKHIWSLPYRTRYLQCSSLQNFLTGHSFCKKFQSQSSFKTFICFSAHSFFYLIFFCGACSILILQLLFQVYPCNYQGSCEKYGCDCCGYRKNWKRLHSIFKRAGL